MIGRMKPPLFVRPLTDPEGGGPASARLRAFTLRRCQILLASADGLRPAQIAGRLACASQSARNAIRAFHAEGLDCLRQKSHRPTSVRPELGNGACERLRARLHRSPRDFGKPTSLWMLALAAEAAHAEGLTSRLVSDVTIRQALLRLGVGWKRAKAWITGPDPAYLRKKRRTDRLIRLAASHPDWVLGYQDEVWRSRLARPGLHAWADGGPMRLHEPSADAADRDPKALACYGMLRGDTGGMLLRFVAGRPVRQVTEDFLAWACLRRAAEGRAVSL